MSSSKRADKPSGFLLVSNLLNLDEDEDGSLLLFIPRNACSQEFIHQVKKTPGGRNLELKFKHI